MLSEKEINDKKDDLKEYVIDLMSDNENLSDWDIENEKLRYKIPQSDGMIMPLTLHKFCGDLTIWVIEPSKNGDECGYITNFKIYSEDKHFGHFDKLLKDKENESKQEELKQEKSLLDKLETELKKTDKKLIRRYKLKKLKKD